MELNQSGDEDLRVWRTPAHAEHVEGLERKVALYERTLGFAVVPVLIRRVLASVARRVPAAAGNPAEHSAVDRRWVAAGPPGAGQFEMFVDPSSAGHGAADMAAGTYDRTFLDALADVSLEGSVVWDVGAHIGYETLLFSRLVGPAGRVVAFEPNPANVVEWERNVSRNRDLADRAVLIRAALAASTGRAQLISSDDIVSGMSSGSHLADTAPPEDAESYATFESIAIESLRGDDVVASGTSTPPGLIKIDVEGAEADVLRGCRLILEIHAPTLLVEIHHVRAMHDVGAVLREAGYTTRLLDSSEESASRCFLKAVRPQ